MADPCYKVNGVVLPTPDEDVEYEEEDMHGKSWRDGAGKMHLVVLRRGVISTPLKWHSLSESEYQTIKNACRVDLGGVYTFEDIRGGTRMIYTGASFKYTLHRVNKKTGEGSYTDASLSFIEM
jgi:hypothetical protein